MIQDIFFFNKRGFFSYRKNKHIKIIFSPLLTIPLILVLISSILIFSIQKQSIYSDSLNHLLTGLIGYCAAILISYIPIERIKTYVMPFYFLILLSLVLIYFYGISTYGAQRWLGFGSFTFQPSEIAKLSTVMALSLTLEKKICTSLKNLIYPLLIVSTPWLLIFFQPDLGTSLVLIFVFFVMLYWVQIPIEWILILVFSIFTAIFSFGSQNLLIIWISLMGLLAYRSFENKKFFMILIMIFHGLVAKITPFLWNFVLKDYQRNRLILFLDPSKDPLGGGYHLIQSKIGVGSGGLFGTGFLNGKLTSLKFIPEQHTDFIFSAVGEETGFIGSVFVVFLFVVLIMRLLRISQNARTDFESLLVIGIASIFLFQIIININMTIGLGPVTGIPLPFMSYGRTSLFINFIFIGLALSVFKRSRTLRKR